MYAIETKNLIKSYHGKAAVNALDMHVPEGAVYGLIKPKSGDILLYGKPYTNRKVRETIGVLIDGPGCFPDHTVYDNLMMQAINLNLKSPEKEVQRVLKLVRMTGSAGRKFKHCSLGMKQRIGLAQALMGHPKLLILDEPINGLDADGVRIVRETLQKVNREEGVTILISSHILGELSKIATHYGIIKNGKLVEELSAEEMEAREQEYILVQTNDDEQAINALNKKYSVIEKSDRGIRIYGEPHSEKVSTLLIGSGYGVKTMVREKITLEEYYTNAMNGGNPT